MVVTFSLNKQSRVWDFWWNQEGWELLKVKQTTLFSLLIQSSSLFSSLQSSFCWSTKRSLKWKINMNSCSVCYKCSPFPVLSSSCQNSLLQFESVPFRSVIPKWILGSLDADKTEQRLRIEFGEPQQSGNSSSSFISIWIWFSLISDVDANPRELESE